MIMVTCNTDSDMKEEIAGFDPAGTRKGKEVGEYKLRRREQKETE